MDAQNHAKYFNYETRNLISDTSFRLQGAVCAGTQGSPCRIWEEDRSLQEGD